MSLAGYLDGGSPTRLVLSNEADLDRVDAERAGCDAIMVGASTVRRDNPRLLVRDEALRRARVAPGGGEPPVKVTVTRRADLDPRAAFSSPGDTDLLVCCASLAVP